MGKIKVFIDRDGKDWTSYVLIFCFVALVGALSVGYVLNERYGLPFSVKAMPLNEEDIIDDCKALSLQETVPCLRDNIKTFFYYNNETIGQPVVNFTELHQNGGVCKDWSDLYERVAERLGFYSTSLSINVDGDSTHRFAVISDETGYCIMDMRSTECFYFGS